MSPVRALHGHAVSNAVPTKTEGGSGEIAECDWAPCRRTPASTPSNLNTHPATAVYRQDGFLGECMRVDYVPYFVRSLTEAGTCGCMCTCAPPVSDSDTHRIIFAALLVLVLSSRMCAVLKLKLEPTARWMRRVTESSGATISGKGQRVRLFPAPATVGVPKLVVHVSSDNLSPQPQ